MNQFLRNRGRSKPIAARPRRFVDATTAQNIGLGLFVVVIVAVVAKGYFQ